MSRLVLCARHLETVKRHAATSYPEECCGFLVGRALGEEGVEDAGSGEAPGSMVERVLSVQNERRDSRVNRYLISPETVLAAQREARGLGLEIVGYYHSHPDHPAVPSDFDREHAWPGLSYLIVAVEGGQAVVARSWRLADDRSRFEEETVDGGAAAVRSAVS